MGDLANLQEFFISQGWGESRQNVSDLANFQEFFISQGWGESMRDLANFQEFFISQGWGESREWDRDMSIISTMGT